MDRVDQLLHYFDPREDIDRHHHLLPHWEQGEGTYFVTFRLADALPQSKLDGWKRELEIWVSLNPKPWTADQEREYHERFSQKIEHWLDQGDGAACCVSRSWRKW